jgi:Fur family transcriptional regulator, ferric uptake regulator
MPKGFGKGPPWFHDKFKDCGCRMTEQRLSILDILSKSSEHPSAEDIYLEVHKIYPDIGLTTVYRTLELLVQMAIASKFDFGDGRARYELFENPKGIGHHHHLVCTNCKKIIDYTDFIEDEIELIKRTEKGLSEKFNFNIAGHVIQFYGLCDRCQNK